QYTGKKQKVGIVTLGAYPNLQIWKAMAQQLRVPFTKNIDIQVVDQSYYPPYTETSEFCMDAQIIGSICPDAHITLYVADSNGLQGFSDAVNAAVEGGCNVVSASLGMPEDVAINLPGLDAMEKALQKAKDNNVTVCISSGDSGAGQRQKNGNCAETASDGLAHIQFPASHPLVLGCGATEMRLEDGKKVETVWNNSDIKGGASTGGVSEKYPLPDYQANIKIPNVNTGKTGRVVPDVAGLGAFNDWLIELAYTQQGSGGQWRAGESPNGGTSSVAPMWTSFITLVNERRMELYKKPLGYVNKHLYEIAAKGGCFNDITRGNNRPDMEEMNGELVPVENAPGYDAQVGYDACTGWGSPIGDKLFDALVALD
ncbi:MAG: hypothetical protein GY765_20050, partial [bacterium]|nr:hypothetical protein [bacterium]